MKISLLITAWKEAETIANCIESMLDLEYFVANNIDFEILLAAPDKETENAAMQKVEQMGISDKYRYIQDPQKGKNVALNMLFQNATGDIWVLTDGDVRFDSGATKHLIEKLSQDLNIFAVTGRPKSADSKNSFMGYIGHLLSDAAHHKRSVDLLENPSGKSVQIVGINKFFPVSGYIYAIRKNDIRIPTDCLVDDAYVSYVVHNSKGKIAYAPDALVFVKYPTNLKDYFKQKNRSAGGYVQLWKYGVVKKETVTRSFKKELRYFWFPIKYAKNPKELFWSLLLYPIRFVQWFQILFQQKILKKDLMKGGGWERIESTK